MATKIYFGNTFTQIAKLDNGKLYKGNSFNQIAKIDGPISINEVAAILHLVLAGLEMFL